MKILITGASSLPGYRTTLEALRKGHEVVALRWRNPIPIEHGRLRKISMDVRELDRFKELLFSERPDVVIHMAALGDVDTCEKDRRLAWSINVEPTTALASWSSKLGYLLVYLSTDYVFDGERGGYREDDPPNPVNYYGLTKLMGEVATRSSEKWAIVRASSIYGLGPGRKNFAKFLIEKLSSSQPVKALVDQYTSPSYAPLLAEALLEVVENNMTGVYHVVGERMSRYEFAIRIANVLGFDKSLIGEASMSDFKWYAKRPRDSSLNCEETRRRLKTDFYSTDRAMNLLKKEYEESLRG